MGLNQQLSGMEIISTMFHSQKDDTNSYKSMIEVAELEEHLNQFFHSGATAFPATTKFLSEATSGGFNDMLGKSDRLVHAGLGEMREVLVHCLSELDGADAQSVAKALDHSFDFFFEKYQSWLGADKVAAFCMLDGRKKPNWHPGARLWFFLFG